MKLFITMFALVTLLGSPIVFADDSDKSKEAVTTADDSDSKRTKEDSGDKKKATEEEPDCD